MKKRILFVDDEPNVLDGLRRMLRPERARWDMSFAESVDAALAVVQAADHDAVVSDVDMPGKDGFALLAQMCADTRTRDIPIVILTGRNDSDIKRRALNLGAADLLNKPVDVQDLIARLRSVLRLKDCQDALKEQNTDLERRVRERTAALTDSRLEIIWRLGKAAEYRDEETGSHVVRVACYCRAIAESLGTDPNFTEALFRASPLHDIGKIGIPDAILLKPGPLDESEWKVMKRHCEIGAEILREDATVASAFQVWRGEPACDDRPLALDPVLEMAASIALTHHEWWDGSGYPQGLSGDAIPLESRIVSIADAYDALCSHRPYKPAYSEADARRMIREEVGRHFDPAVHAAFEASIAELRRVQNELCEELTCQAGNGCLR